ncbi:MAG: alpha/beta hydrolase [Planctomycetia bacterium]|nr:alpha/beta hydrolase [Planctomycetia bacterium]
MVVPEIGLWLALLTLLIGASAWLFQSGHVYQTSMTLVLCSIAIALFLKPTAQASLLGKPLRAQLTEAFGPADVHRAPFSLRAAIFESAPEPAPLEAFEYTKGLKLDFYRAIGRTRAPCVVVIHGGSWVGGNRMDYGTRRELNDWLARQGYAVASIDYRLCPEHKWPAQREDLLAAIEFLRSHATELGIDEEQFVLLGRSAGGQMATATAYWKHDPTIRGVIAIYPPTDFRRTWEVAMQPGNIDHRLNLEWFLGGNPESASAAFDSASGALHVNADAPPTLILQGELDVNVFHEQSELLANRLSDARVPHALVSLPWAAHGFDLIAFNSPGGQITTYSVTWFLEAVTH